MKNKPTSRHEFMRTVACVEHPKLKFQHRLLLQTLASFANYTTGRGAYPGSDYLTKAMGRSWKRINFYARQVEAIGLLVRTQVGRHGKNTEWNFCLDNPAYPDLGGQKGDDQTPALLGGQNLTPLGGQNSPALGGQNLTPLGGHGCDNSTSTSTKPTTNPPTLAAKPAAGGGGGSVKTPDHGTDTATLLADTLQHMNRIYFETEQKVITFSKDNRTALHKLVADRPQAEILAAFTEARNEGVWLGWKYPLIPFFQGYDALVDASKRKTKHKPLTDEQIREAAERSLAARNELFKYDDTSDEPGAESF
jgi:hypothetical protein